MYELSYNNRLILSPILEAAMIGINLFSTKIANKGWWTVIILKLQPYFYWSNFFHSVHYYQTLRFVAFQLFSAYDKLLDRCAIGLSELTGFYGRKQLKNQTFNIKFTKNLILKKDQKFNIKKFTKNRILKKIKNFT